VTIAKTPVLENQMNDKPQMQETVKDQEMVVLTTTDIRKSKASKKHVEF